MTGSKASAWTMRALLGAFSALALAACTMGPLSFGSRILDFGGGGPSEAFAAPQGQPAVPMAAGETFGHGPVRVALLLPLSDPNLGDVAKALANASKLAISFIEANPNIAENITITLRDTGGSAGGATLAANAAVQEGASLILGPLQAEHVAAAGAVAQAAGIPLIGFTNNSSVAGPGVYLLSVLPEAEAKRSVAHLLSKDHRGFAGVFPATPYGAAQERAFRQAVAAIGLSPVAIYTFGSEAEAQGIIAQATPMLKNGFIDTLFLPDRATAPIFGTLLQQAGASGLQVVGSADWDGDLRIVQAPGLAGAIYPAVDPGGLMAIAGEYQARFGSAPPPLATLAYTATILANAGSLSMSNPRYSAAALTAPSGFNGRDGVFRFLANGQSQYGLAIKQVGAGGATMVDGAKL